MIASIRNLTLLSAILPALALTGCGGGSGDGATVFAIPGGGDFVFEPGPGGPENHDVAYPYPPGVDTVLALSWDSNPVEESIQYYEVMYGSEENQVDYFYTQTMNEASFNPDAPAIEIETSDLAHANDGYVCFAVKAYNNFSESDASEAVCTGV